MPVCRCGASLDILGQEGELPTAPGKSQEGPRVLSRAGRERVQMDERCGPRPKVKLKLRLGWNEPCTMHAPY